MKRYKLGFGNRSILEQINICRRVATGIGKLPAEQRRALAPHLVAASVTEAAEAVAEVESLKTTLRAALVRRNEKVAAMRKHTNSAALMITVLTDGSPASLLAAGVGVKKTKQPVGKPGAPTLLVAVGMEVEGTVRLRWQRPLRRCTFFIQMTTAPAATRGWKQAAIGIRQSCNLIGLKSGQKYWFRVMATNAHGPGPWSQPASARVK